MLPSTSSPATQGHSPVVSRAFVPPPASAVAVIVGVMVLVRMVATVRLVVVAVVVVVRVVWGGRAAVLGMVAVVAVVLGRTTAA